MSDKTNAKQATRRGSGGTATKTDTESEHAAPTVETAPEQRKVGAHTGLTVPVLVPEVHIRRLPLPRVGVGHMPVPRVYAPVRHAVESRLPERSTNRLVWFGGLAGLAVFGVIDWPVAAVVAAGTYVAERRAEAAVAHELNEEGRPEPPT